MSYRPPYTDEPHGYPAYPAPSTDNLYDPYAQAPHDSYDRSGYDGVYRDEPAQPPYGAVPPHQSQVKQEPAYEVENYNVPLRPREAKTARDMRTWRYDHQGNLWTAGSRPRCFGRFCCCTILITLFLIIGIVLSLALWIQPPNVKIGGIEEPTNGSTVQVLTDGIQVNLQLPIEVDNPNYFGVKITNLYADVFYPINNTRLGMGLVKDVSLPAHSNTNFTFPFSLNITQALDSADAIISDLATKCLSNPQQQITINYKLKVGVRVFLVTVTPTIDNTVKFNCPVSQSDIENLLKELGLSDIPGLAALLGIGGVGSGS